MPEGPQDCPTCAEHGHHGEDADPLAAEHGQWYVGVAGYGFRTNRCPRSWAANPFVLEVMEGLRWAESGMFASVYGLHVPYRLVEAIDHLRMEIHAVATEVSRKLREKIEEERRKAATDNP